MADTASKQSRLLGQYLLLVAVAAVSAALAAHFAQEWLFGGSNAAVSGAVAGAVGVAVVSRRRKPAPAAD